MEDSSNLEKQVIDIEHELERPITIKKIKDRLEWHFKRGHEKQRDNPIEIRCWDVLKVLKAIQRTSLNPRGVLTVKKKQIDWGLWKERQKLKKRKPTEEEKMELKEILDALDYPDAGY